MAAGDNSVTSSFELKKRLLRAAYDGRSKFTPPQMIAFIQERYRRARAMPPEHREELNRVLREEAAQENLHATLRAQGVPENELPREARAIRALNLLERLHGRNVYWSAATPAWQAMPSEPIIWDVSVPRNRTLH